MLRRLLVVFAVVAASVVGAIPVAASADTQVMTIHFSSQPMFAVPVPCSSVAGLTVVSEDNGNGVLHFTANSNGFWATGTYAGDIQLFPALSVTFDANGNVASFVADPSRPTAQGRVADWFGVSFNRSVVILHDTVDAQVTTRDGQSIIFHMVDHANAIPQPPPNPPIITRAFTDISCH
jgi:hypothetical protein